LPRQGAKAGSALFLALAAAHSVSACTTGTGNAARDAVVTADYKPFNKAVLGLVWCYEKTGELASAYDEDGDCGELGSLWSNASRNPSIVPRLDLFTPSGSPEWAGTYRGGAAFETDKASCAFTFEMIATDGGSSIKLPGPVQCMERTERGAADAATAAAFDPVLQASHGLVWCYEASGRLATEYDDNGHCESFGSIWVEKSENPTIAVTTKSFEPDHSQSPRDTWAGTYDLLVTFKRDDKACRFEAKLAASDDGASVYIYTAPNCI
jgi:hypothetical protein